MKIFKLFVCLLLILSTSLVNSIAAISVSDGSAFVTKAEFAADLNNLSNRMSSLENSLDAKIDSLVSSYLSRNGIWNGEKQTVGDTQYWSIKPGSITLKDNNGSFSDELKREVFIEKTSKSGLLTGFIYYTDDDRDRLNSASSRWGYQITTNGQSRWYADSGFFLSVSIEEMLEGNSTGIVKSSSIIGSALGQHRSFAEPTGGIMAFSLPSQEMLSPVSFFVSKGSKLSLIVKEDAHVALLSAVNTIDRAIRIGFKDEFQIY